MYDLRARNAIDLGVKNYKGPREEGGELVGGGRCLSSGAGIMSIIK